MTIKHLYANGDSFTFGQELGGDSPPDCFYTQTEYQKKFGYVGLLAQHYGIAEVTNSALPGGSNDRIYRTTIADVSELLTRFNASEMFVLVSFTEPSRREFFNCSWQTYYPYLNNYIQNDKYHREHQKLWSAYTTYFDSIIENQNRYITQVIGLQAFLCSNNVKYLFTDIFKTPKLETSIAVFNEGTSKIDWSDINKAMFSSIDRLRYPHDIAFDAFVRTKRTSFGPHGHPLEDGNKLWAAELIRYIDENKLLQG